LSYFEPEISNELFYYLIRKETSDVRYDNLASQSNIILSSLSIGGFRSRGLGITLRSFLSRECRIKPHVSWLTL